MLTKTTTTDRLRAAVEPRLTRAKVTIQEDVAPAVTSALRTAKETSAPARAEALDRATVAYHALRGEPIKVRRWPTALGFFAIGAGAGLVLASIARRSVPPPPVVAERPRNLEDERAQRVTPAAAAAYTP